MNEADNVHHQLGKVDPSPTPIVQENDDDGFSEDEKKSATSHTSVNENNQLSSIGAELSCVTAFSW